MIPKKGNLIIYILSESERRQRMYFGYHSSLQLQQRWQWQQY